MKQFLKNNWYKVSILSLIIGSFIWFGIRPMLYVKACQAWSIDRSNAIDGDRTDALYFYKKCLRQNGIDK
jgi:hypothetical protein